MSLAEMNSYLVRLYADDCFRMLARSDPGKTLRMYALSPDEIAALQELDRDLVEEFAESLKEKRLERIREDYHLLFGHLDPAAMERYTDRFYQLHLVSPDERLQDYSAAFGTFIEATLAADGDAPPWAADLSRYERLDYAARLPLHGSSRAAHPAAQPSRRTRVCIGEGVHVGHFEHEIATIVCALRRGAQLEPAPMGPQNLVWHRVQGKRDPHVFEVSPAAARLLALSDGERTVQELLTSLEREFEADAGSVAEALVQLQAEGLVELRAPLESQAECLVETRAPLVEPAQEGISS